ncbi:MAG: protein kinase [Pirellulaceae bacterium]
MAAKRLINEKKLTPWQAKFLLSGRTQLKIGNYTLLERIDRNELGDRFLALHNSLSRKVVLQFLPKEFNEQSRNFESFIQSANQLTEIDHPNLAHVYDVGSESGVFYVVQENIAGTLISDVPSEKITRTQAVTFIHDLASAIRFLSERQIEHGTIDETKILINAHGQLQIQDLIANELQKKVLEVPDTNQKLTREFGMIDRVAIQSISGSLINRVFGADVDTQLLNIILQLPKSSDAIEQLIKYTTNWSDNGLAVPFESDTPVVKSPTPKKSTPEQALSPKDRQRESIQSKRNQGKVIALASAGVVLVTLISLGIAWSSGAFSIASRETAGESTTNISGDSSQQANVNDGSEALNSNADSSAATNKASLPSRQNEHSADSETKRVNDSNESVKPADAGEIPATIDDTNQKTLSSAEPVKHESTETELPKTLQTASTQKTTVADPENTPAESSQNSSASPSDPFDIAHVTGEKSADTMPAGSSIPPERSTPSENSAGEPSSDLPSQFELAASDNKSEQVIGTVDDSDLKINLVYQPETVGKGKNYFTTQSLVGEKYSWGIFHSKREGETADISAKVFTKDGSLIFQWSEGTDARSPANYLVNALLQVNANGSNHLIRLRKPVILDEIKLDEKNFTAKGSMSVDWLPDNAALQIEMGDLSEENWGAGKWFNRDVSESRPATIGFGENESDNVFWLSLNMDLGGRVDYRLEVQTLGGNNEVVSLKPSQLDSGLESISQRYQALINENERAQYAADNAPYGSKTKTRDYAKDVKKQMEEAQAFRERSMVQADEIRRCVGKPIPWMLTYDLDGQLIEIARSSTFSHSNSSANNEE